MKRYTGLTFTKSLYILFGIGTIISLIIVYGYMDGIFAYRFVMGYVFLTFFLLIYTSVVTILKLKGLKWAEVKKRLIRFISLFILFSGINYCVSYYLGTVSDFYRIFSTSFGLSFGISFIDIIFSKI